MEEGKKGRRNDDDGDGDGDGGGGFEESEKKTDGE